MTTHGMTNSSEFKIWQAMKTRCYNPKARLFHRYGGRGIRVCERWLNSFENFYADMGPRPSPAHSLEREKNDGHYEPSNCKWSTQLEQTYNRHNTVFIEMSDGRKVTTREYCQLTGLNENTLRKRLERGTPLEQPKRAYPTPSYEFYGERLTLDEIASQTGLPSSSIRRQMKKGQHPQDAVEWLLYYQKNPKRSG